VGEGIPRSASGATTEAQLRESREAPVARRATRGALSELFAGGGSGAGRVSWARGAEYGPDFYARREAASNQRASVASISSITMGLVM